MRELTCIICPRGCSLLAESKKDGSILVRGNACKRGEEYAKNELTNPLRSVTTTAFTKNGTVLPVKTDRPIPKDKVFECVKIINNLTLDLPIKAGDIIIKDVFGSNIVAVRNAEE